MTEPPGITVIALAYNTRRFVRRALDCVRRQSYQSIQLVIVDDGSTDGTDRVVEDWIRETGYPCTFLRNPTNLGIPAVFNQALPLAQGGYVTWIADDLWEDDRLERVARLFERLPERVGIVFGDAVLIDAEDNETGALSPARTLRILGHPGAARLDIGPGECVTLEGPFVHESLLWRCFVPAPSVTVRRRIYDVIGPYDATLFIEDLDCWFRASRHFDFAYLRTPLVKYRIHATNFSSGISGRYLESLAETLRRRGGEDCSAATRRARRRHLREETYRVITRLVPAGRRTQALRAFLRYYVPSLGWSLSAFKETMKALALLLGPGSPP